VPKSIKCENDYQVFCNFFCDMWSRREGIMFILNGGRKMVKKLGKMVREIEKMQGSENKGELKKIVIFVMFGMFTMLCLISNNVPKWFFNYFAFVGMLIGIHCICAYFYRKKENSHRFSFGKKILFFASLLVAVIAAIPAFALVGIGYGIAIITKKEYVLKRNFLCFLVEVIYYSVFAVYLIEQTIMFSSDLMVLFVTYVITIVFEIIFRTGIRRVFIIGEYRFYERYKYKSEMDVVSEYVFLITTIFATFYSNSDSAIVFMPVLLWYSIKQIKKYKKERKNADFIRNYLVEILYELEEIYTIYLGTNTKDKFVMSKYLDVERIEYYRKFIEQKRFCFRRKQKQETLANISELAKKIYNMPQKREQIKKEVIGTMNSIVRSLRL